MLLKQDAVKDGRLRPGDVTWRTRRNSVVFNVGPFALLSANMTSSTKSEVRNILLAVRRRSTGNMYKNLVKFEQHVIF